MCGWTLKRRTIPQLDPTYNLYFFLLFLRCLLTSPIRLYSCSKYFLSLPRLPTASWPYKQTAQTTLRHQNNDDLSVPFNPYTYPPHLESWTSAYISLCNIVDKFIDKFSNSERGTYNIIYTYIELMLWLRIDQLLTLIRTSGSGHQVLLSPAPILLCSNIVSTAPQLQLNIPIKARVRLNSTAHRNWYQFRWWWANDFR